MADDEFDNKLPITSAFAASTTLVAEMLLPGKHIRVLDAWVDDGKIYFKIGHTGEEGIPEGAFVPQYTQVGPIMGASFGYAAYLSGYGTDKEPSDG